jgi:dihydrofolate synthase/folylpolyglutamate synthase
MLAAILQAAGYKTGLFTSPHLVSLRERVRVDGRLMPRRSVAAYVDRHRRELARRKLSFFEVIAAMAFEYFARTRVDWAVIETGLGGRLDATNVLQPDLTITTDVGFDHMEFLGTTLRRIAGEKAGIIKPGVPHLIGLLAPDAERVFRDRCRRLGTSLIPLRPRDFRIHPDRNRFDFTANGHPVKGLAPALLGEHQLRNAALVAKAVEQLRAAGLRIPRGAVRDGLRNTAWPGRFQIIESRRRPTLILDVCHNRGGTEAFVETFRRRFPDRRAHVLTGLVKRKEHQRIFDSLGRIARGYHLVPLKTKRSIDLRQLMAGIDFGSIPVRRHGSLDAAYGRLLKTSSRDDIIAIVGSHYLVGEFLERARSR